MSSEQDQERVEIGIANAWGNQVRTMTHAYRKRPPKRYIIDPFFGAGTVNTIYGAPGNLKTMLAVDAGASVVAGHDWLIGAEGGRDGFQTEQAAVLFVDADNGISHFDELAEAVGRAHGLDEDAPFCYLSMPNPPLMITEDNMAALIVLARDELKVGMIIIDNLGLTTDVEENSSEMAKTMSFLRVLADRTGAAVIVIHHQRKGGANNSRAGDALRGHSSIEAALDLALHVVREPGSSEIVIQSTKTRGVDVPRTIARFNYEHKPGTNDLAKAWFDGVAPVLGKNPIRDAILETVNAHGEITKGRLVDAVADATKNQSPRPGVNRIRNWVGEMVTVSGELVEVKNGNSRLIMTPNYHRENYGIA